MRTLVAPWCDRAQNKLRLDFSRTFCHSNDDTCVGYFFFLKYQHFTNSYSPPFNNINRKLSNGARDP